MVFYHLATALSFLAALSSARVVSPLSSVSCYTVSGTGSHTGPLATIHDSTTSTVTTVVDKVVTVTAPGHAVDTVTVNENHVSTSVHSGNTPTFTSTIWKTTTRTSERPTSTYTITSFTTTTTTVSGTTTISTSSGFEPIDSTLPGATYDKRDILPRNTPDLHGATLHSVVAGSTDTATPQAILCATIFHSTHTQTSTQTRTVSGNAGAQKTTVTSTNILTTDAFKTQPSVIKRTTKHTTYVYWTTPIVTTTTTSTITSTSVVPTATFYAACADNNLASEYNGYPVDGYDYAAAGVLNPPFFIESTSLDVTSPYDCCVAAQQTINSTMFFYTPDTTQFTAPCTILYTTYCPTPQGAVQIYGLNYNGSAPAGTNYGNYIGNSNCGPGVTFAGNNTDSAESEAGADSSSAGSASSAAEANSGGVSGGNFPSSLPKW